jgi:predicted thioesterase
MKDIPPGLALQLDIAPEERHTASALGNVGVDVVSTPALIGYLETASHRAILPYCDAGEATVGTRVEVDHLTPAFLGQPVTASARLLSIDGRKIMFEVEATQAGKVVMKGRHGRAIVQLDRLLGKKSAG